ncbi:MAG TPA: SGNH/GDSL hydrolase family protein [Tepidisphaeraceae bacterium]|jgi:lysophospholipase L1-like esterase|nr:SGNH/GDSL hydrolase family protein [Tepidisphaeraceae bacterium]
MQIEASSKLVMIGDSITDCGRAKPVGEGLFDAIGKGYVANVDALLGSVYPERKIRVLNMGTSGNTVRDLAARWQTDVLDLKPNWLSILIGGNDVWRQFDSPRQPESHVGPEEYENTYRSLLAKTAPQIPNIVLMTPFYIEPNPADAMRARMDQYGSIVKSLSKQFKTRLVDTQQAFDAALKHYYPATLSWDRVHPNHIGHMILALAFVRAVGLTGV